MLKLLQTWLANKVDSVKEQRNVNIMNERERLAEAKRIFEGKSCALSYNDDDEWFDDEDEEFAFNVDANNRK